MIQEPKVKDFAEINLKIKRDQDGNILSDFDLSAKKAREIVAILTEYADEREKDVYAQKEDSRLNALEGRLERLSFWLDRHLSTATNTNIPPGAHKDVIDAAWAIHSYRAMLRMETERCKALRRNSRE